MTNEPDAGKAANISQDAVDLRGHQWPSAEMAMHGDVEISRRFVRVEIIERILVDLEPVARVGAQHAMIGEIRVREGHQHTLPGVDAKRKIDVVVGAIPKETGFGDD